MTKVPFSTHAIEIHSPVTKVHSPAVKSPSIKAPLSMTKVHWPIMAKVSASLLKGLTAHIIHATTMHTATMAAAIG